MLIKSAVVTTCDLAGFSTLMAEDWRRTVRLIQNLREHFTDHCPLFWYKSQVGDSFLGLHFPYDRLATYDDLLWAIDEAAILQRVVKSNFDARLCFGLTIGDVVFENPDLEGQSLRGLGPCYGPAINLSFRLSEDIGSGTQILFEQQYQHISTLLDKNFTDDEW